MRQYSKGFTLVELVIVIAIIGILAGIAIPYYTDAQATARGARIVADMTTMQEAYTVYLVKHGMAEKEINTSHASITYDKDIIPMLVKEGYLDQTPVPPVGKAIFVNASRYYKEINVRENAFYYFLNHADNSSRDLLVSLDNGGMDYPLNELTSAYKTK